MKLYEINQAITDLVDPETGELTDLDAFMALNMEWNAKVENLALWIKDLNAEAKAIKEERDSLYERQRAAENKAASVKRFLESVLAGEKFKTPRVAVSYRKSKAIVPDSLFIEWAEQNADDLLTYKNPVPSLTAIRDAMAAGRQLEHVSVEEHNNITIK